MQKGVFQTFLVNGNYMEFSSINGNPLLDSFFYIILESQLRVVTMNSIIEKLLKFKLENKNDIQIAELSNRFSERASYELVLIYKRSMIRNFRHILSAGD